MTYLFDTPDVLKALALSVPAHIVNYGFELGQRPVGGDWFLYSDNGRGMGRQHIAVIPAGKWYFGGLPQYMAAAHPAEILRLYARLEAAEVGSAKAIQEAEQRGFELGAIAGRKLILEAAWALVSGEHDHARRMPFYATAQALASVPLPLITRISA